MKAVSGAASTDVRFSVQNASFQARMTFRRRWMRSRDRHRRQNIQKFRAHAGPVHTRRFQDFGRDFAEIGVKHPHDDRQIDQHQHNDKANTAVENAKLDEQQIDGIQHAHSRQHFCREHPHQNAARTLRRHKGHRPGGRHRDKDAKKGRADSDDHRIGEMLEIVRPLLNHAIAFQCPGRAQNLQRGLDGIPFSLQDSTKIQRIGKDQRHGPGDDRGDCFAACCACAGHDPPLCVQILANDAKQEDATMLARMMA